MNNRSTSTTASQAQFYCPVTDEVVKKDCLQVCVPTMAMIWWNCPICLGWHVTSKIKEGEAENIDDPINCEECHPQLRMNITVKK